VYLSFFLRKDTRFYFKNDVVFEIKLIFEKGGTKQKEGQK